MPGDDARNAVSWGELLWDLFPSGACLGGAPSNLAVHLASIGIETSLVTRVGNDELGEAARRALEARGVGTRGVQVDNEMQTGRVGIALEGDEARYTLHRGAWQRISCDSQAASLLRTTRAICFGTLSQESPEGLASWREALTHLPGDAIRFCDPNLRGGRIDAALVLEHMQSATVVKINEDEATVLEKTYGCSDAVQWLLDDMGVDVVAKTLGPRGAVLTSHGECARADGFAARSGGDNVGAGDAFGAILVAGLLSEAPLANIVESANRYGSFVASHRGATPEPSSSLLGDTRSALRLL